MNVNLDRRIRARKPYDNSISARWFEYEYGDGVNYSMVGAWVKFYLRVYLPYEHKNLMFWNSSLFVTDDNLNSAVFPYSSVVEIA